MFEKNKFDRIKSFIIKNYPVIIMLIAVLSIVPLFAISIYSRPSADDYSYSRHVIGMIRSGEANFFNLLAKAVEVDILEWKTYDGPYISQIIMTLQPGIFGEDKYFIGAVVLIILVFLSIWKTVCNLMTVFFESFGERAFLRKLCIALIFTAGLLVGMPCISEGIYWFDGAWNYLPFFFLTLLNVSWIIKLLKGDAGLLYVILASLVAFIASGGNYIVTYANVLLLFTIGLYAFFKKKYVFIMPFAFSLAGFCLEFFAPGRMIRTGEDMAESQGILSALLGAAKGTYIYICEWVNIQYVMFMALVACGTLLYLKKRVGRMAISGLADSEGRKISYKAGNKSCIKTGANLNPLWLILYTLCFVGALFVLPYYATGGVQAGRILNIIWFVFVIFSSVDLIYILMYFEFTKSTYFTNKIYGVDATKSNEAPDGSETDNGNEATDGDEAGNSNKANNSNVAQNGLEFVICMICIVAALGICFFNDSDSLRAVRELRNGTAQTFAAQNDARYEAMRAAKEGDELSCEPLIRSEILFFADLDEDPEGWQNQAWKRYYGVGMHVEK